MIITKKKKIGPAMWVMECPKCGAYCASAAERSWLPECTSCDCDTRLPRVHQYYELKEKHPDTLILFRCGDYYETYEDDAKTCANVLGITLRRRPITGGYTAGFPHYCLDQYLPKLIRAGHRVVICGPLNDK